MTASQALREAAHILPKLGLIVAHIELPEFIHEAKVNHDQLQF
jgi:hypothetical protein